jgi:endoglucanase
LTKIWDSDSIYYMNRRGFIAVRLPVSASVSLLLFLASCFSQGTQGAGSTSQVSSFPSVAGPFPKGDVGVKVSGNHLVDLAGKPVRLLGVDRSGAEFSCVNGTGFFDGPTDSTSIAAMLAWHIDAVRLPLNEDCWLGINGVSATYSGTNYASAIGDFVHALNAAGLVVILDLHWNAPGMQLAKGQQVMADADHSVAFWSSVASYFKSDPGVVFDLYNEPHDISWSCWQSGCTTSGGWQAAGMQSLVNAVRQAGASQPIMLGGLNWAGDLSSWLAYEPNDPDGQLIASLHVYNFAFCNSSLCWNNIVAPLSSKVPVVTGELGENDCGSSFINSYMPWADSHDISYLGWTWNTWSCTNGPALISDYNGTPTSFGQGLQAHLASLSASLAG